MKHRFFKKKLCHAPKIKRTAKILSHGKVFFSSSTLRKNETSFLKKTLPCARNKTHGKDLVRHTFSPRHTVKYFYPLPYSKKNETSFFKKTLPRAEIKRTAKILFVVRFLHDARQSFLPLPHSEKMKHRFLKKTLSCAQNKTHGKDLVCPEFSPRCTVKYFFLFHTPKK
jgi:hypothetical protein